MHYIIEKNFVSLLQLEVRVNVIYSIFIFLSKYEALKVNPILGTLPLIIFIGY